MFLDINRRAKILTLAVLISAQSPMSHAQLEKPASPSTQPSSTRHDPQKAGHHRPPTNPTASSATEDTCLKLYTRFIPSFKELWSKRSKDLRIEHTDGYALIDEMTPEHCKDEETKLQFITLLAKILNHHTGRVGIILPIGAKPHLRLLIAAFEKRARHENLDPQKVFVIIDNQGKPEKTAEGLASLIFEHKVSTIIGGSEPDDANLLKMWAPRLQIPLFLLIEPSGGTTPSPFIFNAYPSQKVLADAAVAGNQRFGHKRVSLLMPNDQRAQRFIGHYTEAAKKADISVIHQVTYDAKRFDLMEAAARKIFRLDPIERRDELKKLYETAKKHAQENGERFNPKMVALQPDIQQDAIMIPDTFKIVRHFAKIFRYLGVRHIPLFGHYEWRSKGLITPWDGFLNGSYFVDLQGSYLALPAPIRLATNDSPLLLPPDKVEQADFSLLAWRAVEVPLQLSQKKTELRRKLNKLVPKTKETTTGSATEPSAPVTYSMDNNIHWTPSLFSVTQKTSSSGTIQLLGP
jgi:hypothetical protein